MTDRIKILYLAANPRDTSHLRLQEEAREMEDRIRQGPYRDSFEVIHLLAVRSRDLLRGLQEIEPHILHFSGHGTEDKEIVLEADDGASQPVSPKDLAQLVGLFDKNLKLAVLSCCFSRKQAKALNHVLDFTIGAATPVSDAGVVNFSASFYQVLASGGSINQAFSAALLLNHIAGKKVFATSDLFVRQGADVNQPFIEILPQNAKPAPPQEVTPTPAHRDRSANQITQHGEIASAIIGDTNTTTNTVHK
jgi:CHAT domain